MDVYIYVYVCMYVTFILKGKTNLHTSTHTHTHTSTQKQVAKIHNALKINDWTIIENEFDDLNKRVESKRALFGAGTPRFYIKLCVTIEEKLAEVREKVCSYIYTHTHTHTHTHMYVQTDVVDFGCI